MIVHAAALGRFVTNSRECAHADNSNSMKMNACVCERVRCNEYCTVVYCVSVDHCIWPAPIPDLRLQQLSTSPSPLRQPTSERSLKTPDIILRAKSADVHRPARADWVSSGRTWNTSTSPFRDTYYTR